MVGDRPLYIALCKPSCEQLHGRFHRVVLTVHAGFEPRSSKYGAQSIPSALGAKAMAQIASRATLLRHAARDDILRLARRTRTRYLQKVRKRCMSGKRVSVRVGLVGSRKNKK